ncbi:MAG: RadC family protein [Bacteroidales bacterium]
MSQKEEKHKHLPIKTWAKDDRPREKLAKNGASYLSDAELIAILIGNGGIDESALDLAKRMLSAFDNKLQNIVRLSADDFMKFKGVGLAKASVLLAAFELGRRRISIDDKKIIIRTSKDIINYVGADLRDLQHEEFWIILLSRSNAVIERRRISMGGVSGTFVDVKIIFKLALDKLASAIVLLHNHPSGSLEASREDKELTNTIKSGCQTLGITLLDHIIITQSSYFSFADKNII